MTIRVNYVEQFIKFKKTMVFQMLVTAAAAAGAALALGFVPAAKGFALGSLFSVGNFLLMAHHVPKRLGQDSKTAGFAGFLNLLIRLGLLACPLFLAFHLPKVSVLWTALGILNLQFSVLLYGLMERFGLNGGSTVEGR